MFLRRSYGLLYTFPLAALGAVAQTPDHSGVDWQPCGEGFQCGNVSVPLNHHNESDPRTMNIAVNRFLATDQRNRSQFSSLTMRQRADQLHSKEKDRFSSTLVVLVCSISLVAPGPNLTIFERSGGSGTQYVFSIGSALSVILQGMSFAVLTFFATLLILLLQKASMTLLDCTYPLLIYVGVDDITPTTATLVASILRR